MKPSCHWTEIITIHHHQTICMRGEDVFDKIGCFLKHCCYLLLDLVDSFWILLTCYNCKKTKKLPFIRQYIDQLIGDIDFFRDLMYSIILHEGRDNKNGYASLQENRRDRESCNLWLRSLIYIDQT